MASNLLSKVQNALPLGNSKPQNARDGQAEANARQKSAYKTANGKEESLTTVLTTHVDRTNLLLLVSDCTEAMRAHILATHDPSKLSKAPDNSVNADVGNESFFEAEVDDEPETSTSAPIPAGSMRLPNQADDGGDAHAKASPRDSLDGHDGILDADPAAHADSAIREAEQAEKDAKTEEQRQKAAEDKAKREHEKRLKECTSTKMSELKVAALDFFDDWRDRVIERVGSAVNEQDQDTPKAASEDQDASVVAGGDAPDESENDDVKLEEDDEATSTALHDLYPPRATLLTKLRTPQRALILHSLLLLLLGLESYPAHSRILLIQITSSLHLPLSVLTADETKVAQGLLEAAAKHMSADDETRKKAENNVVARRWKVGIGAVAGAVLLGVTGGLAAPLLAAGLGSVMGGLGLGATAAATYLGALAGSAPVVGALFGAYGGKMTGQMVDSYAKEVTDFSFIPVQPQKSLLKQSPGQKDHRLRVAIGISGWLTEEAEVVKPWTVFSTSSVEPFALRWELQALLNLGNSISTYVSSAAWGFAQREIIRHTVFAAFAAAMWPIAALKAGRIVDNPFSVAKARAEKAGEVLADALINKVQGERPVTLVGYGLGATMIFSCLNSLARRRQFGLIENAVLAGAPAPSTSASWRTMRTVVTGRLVNVHSVNDYLLAFLYRASSMQLGVAGLQAITSVAGIENVNASDIVQGHLEYRFLTGSVLQRIGFDDVDLVEVEKQAAQLKTEEGKLEAERKQQEHGKAGESVDDEDIEQMEKEVEKKNRASGFFNQVGNTFKGLGDSVSSLGKQKDRDDRPREA